MKQLIILCLLLANTAFADKGNTISHAADLYRAVYEQSAVGTDFDVTVTATTPAGKGPHERFACEDDTGATVLTKERDELTTISVKAGERIRVTGRIELSPRSNSAYADCRKIEHVGEGPVRPPIEVSAADLLAGRHDCRPALVHGILRDVFCDEIDPEYLYVVLIAGTRFLYVPFKTQQTSYEQLNRLVGAEVSVVGISIPVEFAARRRIGRTFQASNGLESLHVVHKALTDPFVSSPRLLDIKRMSPQDIVLLNRHRATGRVIALWNGNHLLIRDKDGTMIGVTLARGPLPSCGETIDIVGFPESDLYRLNLTRAIWQPSASKVQCQEVPRETTIDAILRDSRGRRRFDPYAHGQTLRLKGEIVSLPESGNADKRLTLRNGEHLVAIDVSARPEALRRLEIGCFVDVTGTCIMESDGRFGTVAFPRICGIALVIRTADDIRILSRPAWWTPHRLMAAIGSLILLLVAIICWNFVLRKLVERKGKQLFKAQIAQTMSELKVDERTRLAVELHDSISQNIAGASMQIDAAKRQLDQDLYKTAQHLSIASKTLESCREELRNCIWDLRNQALDEPDMNEAIRRTLERHLGEARLTVRFNIQRTKFSDNTINAILCIIRELATNAVRHGQASEVKVAGGLEGCRLIFSVRDNGCGFQPMTAPGMAQGHFGLQGIRERLKRLNGTLQIESRPEQGTKAVVALDICSHDKENNHDQDPHPDRR